jgi:hypothetical protein
VDFVFTHSDIIVMGEWGVFICDDLALFMDYGWLSLGRKWHNGTMNLIMPLDYESYLNLNMDRYIIEKKITERCRAPRPRRCFEWRTRLNSAVI